MQDNLQKLVDTGKIRAIFDSLIKRKETIELWQPITSQQKRHRFHARIQTLRTKEIFFTSIKKIPKSEQLNLI